MEDPLSYFSFQSVLHNWCNKSSVCYFVYVMVHIKDSVLLIEKSNPCSGVAAGFLSRCLDGHVPCVRRHIA